MFYCPIKCTTRAKRESFSNKGEGLTRITIHGTNRPLRANYFTKRSLRDEQIDGSQDSVCSCSLFPPEENQAVIFPGLDLLGETDGFPFDEEADSVSFPLWAVRIFSIALPRTCASTFVPLVSSQTTLCLVSLSFDGGDLFKVSFTARTTFDLSNLKGKLEVADSSLFCFFHIG